MLFFSQVMWHHVRRQGLKRLIEASGRLDIDPDSDADSGGDSLDRPMEPAKRNRGPAGRGILQRAEAKSKELQDAGHGLVLVVTATTVALATITPSTAVRHAAEFHQPELALLKYIPFPSCSEV